jgi:hypothetical protein
MKTCLRLLVVGLPLAAQVTRLTVTPGSVTLAPGSASPTCFEVKPEPANADLANLQWTLIPDTSSGSVDQKTGPKTCYTPPEPNGTLAPAGVVVLKAELKDAKGTASVAATAEILLRTEGNNGGEFSRIITGFEQAAAASSNPARKMFIDLYFSRPFPWPLGKPQNPTNDNFAVFGPRTRIWGDVRLSSVPQQIAGNVATLAAQFGQKLGEVKVNELVQSAEFLAGFEVRLMSNKFNYHLFDRSGRSRTSLSAIAGYGIITPLTPRDVADIYEKPGTSSSTWAQFAREYPAAAAPGYQAIAFVTQERDRFFRQYYAGLRFQSHYFNDADQRVTRPPHQLDVVFGQNEAVTGGRLHGLVMRMDGFYALPFEKGSFIYLFATGMFKAFARPRANDPLLLRPSTLKNADGTCPTGATCRTLYDPEVFIAPIPTSNRDTYRIGVGIDFVQLIKVWRKAPAPATDAAKPAPAAPKPEAPKAPPDP